MERSQSVNPPNHRQILIARLAELGIRPNKHLGQNFLINSDVIKRIESVAEGLMLSSPDTLIEVGPGLGALTDCWWSRPNPVTLIEFDRTLAEFWRRRIGERSDSLWQLRWEDAVKTPWDEMLAGIASSSGQAVVVGNLPYNIAATLVMEFETLHRLKSIKALVFMFQKEVAQRAMASVNSPDYGIFAVVCQSFWHITRIVDAGPRDFYPVPNVGSRVLQFTPKASSDVSLWDADQNVRRRFVSFVKLAFSQRRKKLLSNLQGQYKEELIRKAFAELQLSESARAQELPVIQFRELFSKIEV